ncbi:MAG: protein kinase [Planctomycetota bacterium]
MPRSLCQYLDERGLVLRERLQEALAEALGHEHPRAALAMLLLRRRWATPEALAEAFQATGRVASEEQVQPRGSLGDYRVVRELARGGMGVVYEVEHAVTGGRYALKTILGEVARLEDRARFAQEARLAAAIEHPHVARLHTAELEGELPYLVQDLLRGGDLTARVERGGPLPEAQAVALVELLAGGVAAAHAKGVLHRDLKPQNVLFDERGAPKITDFGLARRLGSTSLRLTATGELLGTPSYMAPEQVDDARGAGPAADVYALGGILCFALTGHPPFAGGSLWETLDKVLHAPPPDLRREGVSAGLAQLVTRLLDKDPGARPSAAELAELLAAGELRAGPPRRAALALLGVVGLALTGGALLTLRPAAGQSEPTPSTEPEAPTRDPFEGLDPRVVQARLDYARAPNDVARGLAAARLLELPGSRTEDREALERLVAGVELPLAAFRKPEEVRLAFDPDPARAWLVLLCPRGDESSLELLDLQAGARRWSSEGDDMRFGLTGGRLVLKTLGPRHALRWCSTESGPLGEVRETETTWRAELLARRPERMRDRIAPVGVHVALSRDGERTLMVGKLGLALVYGRSGAELARYTVPGGSWTGARSWTTPAPRSSTSATARRAPPGCWCWWTPGERRCPTPTPRSCACSRPAATWPSRPMASCSPSPPTWPYSCSTRVGPRTSDPCSPPASAPGPAPRSPSPLRTSCWCTRSGWTRARSGWPSSAAGTCGA